MSNETTTFIEDLSSKISQINQKKISQYSIHKLGQIRLDLGALSHTNSYNNCDSLPNIQRKDIGSSQNNKQNSISASSFNLKKRLRLESFDEESLQLTKHYEPQIKQICIRPKEITNFLRVVNIRSNLDDQDNDNQINNSKVEKQFQRSYQQNNLQSIDTGIENKNNIASLLNKGLSPQSNYALKDNSGEQASKENQNMEQDQQQGEEWNYEIIHISFSAQNVKSQLQLQTQSEFEYDLFVRE
ncbi:UNKNOWN [Stylonychia lemnae]|uniref:Uncharacterized protein n=1 Tax=Stylonychia lemnae TaxID=5949 RepID=A0A077ZYY9_STYLE|nr:UNKNOWN [Stylonychia lemnae]|eukprot:CDW75130.1 UNKNOWN [Stylonychia lemnae]